MLVILFALALAADPIFTAPCADCSYTSPYGRRNDYINYPTFHDGVDFADNKAPGAWVLAMADGTVTHVVRGCREGYDNCPYAGSSEWIAGRGNYGNSVTVRHDSFNDLRGQMPDWETSYNHLVSVAVNVGDRVYQGQVLGRQGQTGASRGVHVHVNFRPAFWDTTKSGSSPGGQLHSSFMSIDPCSGTYRTKRSGLALSQMSKLPWLPFQNKSKPFVGYACPAMNRKTTVPAAILADPAFPPAHIDCHADGTLSVQGSTHVGWGACISSSACKTFSVKNRCPRSPYRCCILNQTLLPTALAGDDLAPCGDVPSQDARCFPVPPTPPSPTPAGAGGVAGAAASDALRARVAACPERWELATVSSQASQRACSAAHVCCVRSAMLVPAHQGDFADGTYYRTDDAATAAASDDHAARSRTIAVAAAAAAVLLVVVCCAVGGVALLVAARRRRHGAPQWSASSPPTPQRSRTHTHAQQPPPPHQLHATRSRSHTRSAAATALRRPTLLSDAPRAGFISEPARSPRAQMSRGTSRNTLRFV